MEVKQLSIFDSGLVCDHCQEDPGMKNEYHWNGFLDKDTGQQVCWSCRYRHYQLKSVTKNKNLYSEFPVIIF